MPLILLEFDGKVSIGHRQRVLADIAIGVEVAAETAFYRCGIDGGYHDLQMIFDGYVSVYVPATMGFPLAELLSMVKLTPSPDEALLDFKGV